MRAKYEEVSQRMNELFYQGFSEEEKEIFESSLARIRETLVRAEECMRN